MTPEQRVKQREDILNAFDGTDEPQMEDIAARLGITKHEVAEVLWLAIGNSDHRVSRRRHKSRLPGGAVSRGWLWGDGRCFGVKDAPADMM